MDKLIFGIDDDLLDEALYFNATGASSDAAAQHKKTDGDAPASAGAGAGAGAVTSGRLHTPRQRRALLTLQGWNSRPLTRWSTMPTRVWAGPVHAVATTRAASAAQKCCVETAVWLSALRCSLAMQV